MKSTLYPWLRQEEEAKSAMKMIAALHLFWVACLRAFILDAKWRSLSFATYSASQIRIVHAVSRV